MKQELPTAIDPLLRVPAVIAATGVSKSSLYAMIREGTFPKPIPLGPRCVAWPASRVQQWIDQRVKAAGEA